VGAAVGGLGVSTLGATAAAAGGTTLTLNVAALGDTFRLMLAPGASPPDRHAGSVFVIEGWIYPAGTIPGGDGFEPGSATSIGRWFCRGWFLDTPARHQPALLTTQEYLLGEISPAHLFPPDQLVSSGLEQAVPIPGYDPTQPAIRSVIGGTGRYAGASGVVIQHSIGHNTTKLIAGLREPAPNFRFEFELR